ncbi:MAG: 4-hydroxy-tetrahydrodipicolinate reductase [Alphaproteobacteria bacterium]|nr:4-hydroxy-tetrahydrodipicolinate reductase [Alphaproteobacteria bacterium]
MISVGVQGAAGRMGRLLVAGIMEAEDLQLGAMIERRAHPELGKDAGQLAGQPRMGVLLGPMGGQGHQGCDVIIDFSLPEGTRALLDSAPGCALVIGTTGLGDALRADLRAYAERHPVVLASNFSTGVNLLLGLVAQAAALAPDYHVEIVEMHHRHKVDAPSGTALSLGRAVAEARGQSLSSLAVHGREGRTGARSDQEIGFHSLRGGDVAGEHTVYLAGPGERLSLGHLATSRSAFAGGALRAARWVVGQAPGLYDMQDVLGLR